MKNKRLTIILIIFTVFVLVICLTSALFMLNSVSVNFLSTATIFVNRQQDIIDSGQFDYGKNVLFLNKKKYIQNLELNNPYLKVINIETIFPNKLKINCIERAQLFYVEYGENIFALDEDFKVLDKLNYNYEDLINIDISCGNELVIGQVCYEIMNIYKQLSTILKEWNIDVDYLKSKIKSVKISNNILKIRCRDKKDIIIKNWFENASEKSNIAFSVYEDDKIYDYDYISVYENSSKKITCVVGKY